MLLPALILSHDTAEKMEGLNLCVTSENNVVLDKNGRLLAWNSKENALVHLDNTPEIKALFGLVEADQCSFTQAAASGQDNNIQSASKASAGQLRQALLSTGPHANDHADSSDGKNEPSQASWRDEKAVKALIDEWKRHESYFKSTTIVNKKVWIMIAEKLNKENKLWVYTGQQCEDKFKDVRKNYTKTIDHNKQSGAEFRTCKYFHEMESVLGDKPAIKPVSLASSLKKRKLSANSPISNVNNMNSQSDDDSATMTCTSGPKRKKNRKERDIDKLMAVKMEEYKKREEARLARHTDRMERQDRGIEVYKETMERLLEKL